jgi:DNA repair protein RecN (Recombination protein N)
MRLLRLTIDDFGLIPHAIIEFADGLTVCSGETGTGKTMLLGALRFALGERSEADLIRAGAERARVALEIEPDDALRARVLEAGCRLSSDDAVVITRELALGGRSYARVNGVVVSAGQLRGLAETIVDVVGQHDAQRLLAPAFALDIVDRFAGPDVVALRGEVRESYGRLERLRETLESLRAADGRAVAELEFARFALAEIDAAGFDDDEDRRLRDRREVLANADRIVSVLGAAGAALEDEGGAVDALGTAAAALGTLARFGERYAQLAAAVGALQSDVTDVAGGIGRERELVDADPAELERIIARLDVLDRLKKKYGGSLEAVRATRAEFAAVIDRDATRDRRLAEAERDAALVAEGFAAACARLSAQRQAAVAAVASLVTAELAALAMPSARFSIGLEPLERAGPAGAERAELRLAAHPGEPQRPLAKVASGGERSRVLLALIVVIADRRERTTLVFDEIDAGIGGATAVAVGARLGRLAATTQIVVVTHLAQIASWADAHYALRKHEAARSTTIEVETLAARQAQLEEIARMLSGDATAVSLEHAATLVAGTRSA